MTLGLMAAGCAGGAADDTGHADSDLAETGTCRVMHEDSEVVVLRAQDGKMMYAGKQLHVIDVRISNAIPNQPRGSRFASGHIQYTIAPRVRPDALRRLGQLVGPGTPMAAMTIDAATARVSTAILPVSTTSSANADGSANVELSDAPSGTSTPLLDAALRKQLVTGAKANATISCGTNAIPIALDTTNVIFDTTQAKVLEAAKDLDALGTFLDTASSIRADAFKAPLAELGDAELGAKMLAFADVVDRELQPVLQGYGGTMSRAEVKTRLEAAYAAYRDLSATVLSAAKDTNSVDGLQRRNADGSYSFADDTSAIVTELLPSANALRGNVEKALADGGDGWVLKNLQ